MKDPALTLKDEVRQLIDTDAVRAVIMRYCRGIDRRDLLLLDSVFHSDAIDEHAGRRLSGPSLAQQLLDWILSFKVTAHHITTQTIRVDRDIAACESYYTAWLIEEVGGQERPWHTVGRYVDRLERRNGEWRIAHRVVVMETARYLAPAEVPAGAHLGVARQDRTDPSYSVLGN